MTYNVLGINKTVYPMGFYALYIGPSDSGTCHIHLNSQQKMLLQHQDMNLTLWLEIISPF